MAKIDLKMPEDFLLRLSRLGEQTDSIIPKVLEAGGEVILNKVRANLSAVIGSDTKHTSRSTGQLESALGLSSAKQDKNSDWNIKIGFSENRPDGKSNAMLANVLEYGKHGQPPKPFLKPAKSQTKQAVIEAMKNRFESEADGI